MTHQSDFSYWDADESHLHIHLKRCPLICIAASISFMFSTHSSSIVIRVIQSISNAILEELYSSPTQYNIRTRGATSKMSSIQRRLRHPPAPVSPSTACTSYVNLLLMVPTLFTHDAFCIVILRHTLLPPIVYISALPMSSRRTSSGQLQGSCNHRPQSSSYTSDF